MVKSLIYFIVSLATMFYALPRIPLLGYNNGAFIFSIVWLLFGLLVVGAHLDQMIFLDEKKRKRLARLKKIRYRKQEQIIMQMQTKRQASR